MTNRYLLAVYWCKLQRASDIGVDKLLAVYWCKLQAREPPTNRPQTKTIDQSRMPPSAVMQDGINAVVDAALASAGAAEAAARAATAAAVAAQLIARQSREERLASLSRYYYCPVCGPRNEARQLKSRSRSPMSPPSPSRPPPTNPPSPLTRARIIAAEGIAAAAARELHVST